MGITDNLFHRKNVNYRQQASRQLSGGSQQYRLNNKAYFTQEATASETASSGGRQCPQSAVTCYILQDKRSVPSSTPYSSMANLTLTSNFTEADLGYPRCVCFRDSSAISCENLHCNWSGVGRVRSCCPCHPTVTFLLDLPQCPQCFGPLKEIPDRPQDDDGDL